MYKDHSVSIICGFLMILIGLVSLFGWVFHISHLFQLLPNTIAMVANSAICFIITGSLLLYIAINGPQNDYIKLTMTIATMLICSLSLVEAFFHINLGMSNLFLKAWVVDNNPTPGRMAITTAFSFLILSTTLLLLPYGHKKHVISAIQVMNFLIFLLALLGITIYSLRLEEIYSAYSYTRMSFHTAIGLVIASIGLWFTYKKYDWYLDYYRNNPHHRIITVIGMFFVAVSIIAAFGDITIVTYRTLKTVEANLEHSLQEKVSIFDISLKSFTHDAEATVDDPTIMKMLTSEQVDAGAIKQRMSLLLARGYSALRLENKSGKTIWEHGNFIKNSNIKLPLNYLYNPILLWNEGFVLHTSIPLKDSLTNQVVGNFVTEKKLDYFNNIYRNYFDLKNTGETLICGKITDNNYACFPSRLSSKVITQPTEIEGKISPVAAAVNGQNGVGTNYDYRHERVLAAYAPIKKLGIGMVLKIDANEIYKPLHEDLLVAMLIAAGLVTIGLLLLKWQISPLVNKLITSEKKANVANAKLKESEDRYEVAISSSNTGLWDWELETNNIYFSPYFKYLIGYNDDEFPNDVESYKALIHPDDKERVLDNIKNHLYTDQPYDIEYRLRKKTGEYHWYHAIGQAVRKPDGKPIRMAGSLTDVTDRKKAESRLGMQYELTKVLSEATNIETVAPEIIAIIRDGFHWSFGSIWVVDKEHHVMRCLATSCIKELEHSRFKEETEKITLTIGTGLPGRVWESCKPLWIETQQDTSFSRMDASREARIKTGFAFPILLHGTILGVIEFFSLEKQSIEKDIYKTISVIGDQIAQFIQRTDFMFEIKENEAHMAAILSSASDSIITMDEQGCILTYNPQTMKMFHIYDVNLYKKNISILIPDLTTQKMNDILDQPAVEFTTINNEGENFSLELLVSSMMVNEKKMLVAIIRDITERKKIEKLKNEFISVVSHELRTPLTSIRGALTLLLSGNLGKFDENASKFLQIANNNCDRLLNLINDILDIEKIEAGKMNFNMTHVNIDTLVRDSINNNQMYGAKYNVKIGLRNTVKNVIVNADPDRLMQVLNNLISNAVKFSPTSGKVEIDVTLVNEVVRVAVIDKGAGISDEFKSKIFQKFSQADSSSARKTGGTGLGLNITKAMIEKMGGSINFVSKANQGTIFYFDLPTVKETVPQES